MSGHLTIVEPYLPLAWQDPMAWRDTPPADCGRCSCPNSYEQPPAVQECPCGCHDSSRALWKMNPWHA